MTVQSDPIVVLFLFNIHGLCNATLNRRSHGREKPQQASTVRGITETQDTEDGWTPLRKATENTHYN